MDFQGILVALNFGDSRDSPGFSKILIGFLRCVQRFYILSSSSVFADILTVFSLLENYMVVLTMTTSRPSDPVDFKIFTGEQF